MTWEEILEKYSLVAKRMSNERRINFLKAKGIIVEQTTIGNRWHPTQFKIIDDSIFYADWVQHPYLPRELTKDGKVRESDTKNLCALLPTTDGYLCCFVKNKKYLHHRMLMETFNPTENSDVLCVDHINGRKQDNRLENLRWVDTQKNLKYRSKNRKEINDFINLLIQKYGYEKTLEIIKKDLTKYL